MTEVPSAAFKGFTVPSANDGLDELAAAWACESGDVFGDPRIAIPALVAALKELRAGTAAQAERIVKLETELGEIAETWELMATEIDANPVFSAVIARFAEMCRGEATRCRIVQWNLDVDWIDDPESGETE